MHDMGGMRCSTKIYKGDEGGSRVILRYCNEYTLTPPDTSIHITEFR
jgi:hypothetical protein